MRAPDTPDEYPGDRADSDDAKGGLTGTAQQVLMVLAGCHLSAGGIRAGVLPPEPAAEGKSESWQPTCRRC